MAQLISLSRAARLVGVKRATLQKQIRAGELHTFEGELDLSEILKLYPQTDVDNSGMIERADRIIEQALGKLGPDSSTLPEPEVLAARVTGLSHELGTARARVNRYTRLMNQLQDKIDQLDTPAVVQHDIMQLRAWLREASEDIDRPHGLPEEVLATDTFLRLMAAHVTLKPGRHEFFVEGPESILEAALRAGYRLAYGCTDGRCGKCRARLRSGNVKQIKSGPTPQQEQQLLESGDILMCTHTAITDTVLEVEEIEQPDDIDSQTLAVSVRRVAELSDTMRALYLTPQSGCRLQFMSGQSVELMRGDVRRRLPVASCPCDATQIELHIQQVPGEPLSDYVFSECRAGDKLSLHGPMDDFVLNIGSVHSLIFLAWGDRFAAIKSLVEQAMALDVAEEIWVYWVYPAGRKPYLHNLCRAWEDALDNLHYSRLEAPPELFGESIGADPTPVNDVLATLARQHYQVRSYDFYVSAPAEAAQSIRRYLVTRGVPPAQIRLGPGLVE